MQVESFHQNPRIVGEDEILPEGREEAATPRLQREGGGGDERRGRFRGNGKSLKSVGGKWRLENEG